jgi:arsenate reductase
VTDRPKTTIYHNPRCSKSRAALAILALHGTEPFVIEYLKNPPSKEELQAILKKLAMKPAQLVRKGEPIYKEKFANRAMSDDQWLDALAKYPILMERPIVMIGDRALIGRPPEKIAELL